MKALIGFAGSDATSTALFYENASCLSTASLLQTTLFISRNRWLTRAFKDDNNSVKGVWKHLIIDFDEKRKQVYIWLDSKESSMAVQESRLKGQMENLYKQFHGEGIGVTVFHSGYRDLLETTGNLLKQNLNQ